MRFLLIAMAAIGCSESPKSPPAAPRSATSTAGPLSAAPVSIAPAVAVAPSSTPDGAALAKVHCGRCHLAPQTDELPKAAWRYVLALMGVYLGHDEAGVLDLPDSQSLVITVDRRLAPKVPLVTAAEWAAIRAHYLDAPGAPKPIFHDARPDAPFQAVLMQLPVVAPIVSMVQVPRAGGLRIAEVRSNSLVDYRDPRAPPERRPMPGPIVDLWVDGGVEYALSIGHIQPKDALDGAIYRLDPAGPQPVLEGLHRTVRIRRGDLDGDGDEDLLACEFGHFDGRLAWYERVGAGYTRHVLLARPGAVDARIVDLDRDGRLDLLVLMAQAREGLYLFRGVPGGFEQETLIERAPTFGYTDLHLVDMDGDGVDEILTINGDNGELQGTPLRNSHGVRISKYAAGTFTEVAFVPMHGAFRTVPGDYDGDGDIDLPVISFFPPAGRTGDGFTWFENLGGLKFVRRTVPDAAKGRWMTIAGGDIDGDGDLDLLLGAGYPDARVDDPALAERLRQLPGLLMLLNRSR